MNHSNQVYRLSLSLTHTHIHTHTPLLSKHTLILSPHLHLQLLSGLFCLVVYGKMLYTFIIFPALPVCVTHFILHGYLQCTYSRSFNRDASAESMTSNVRVHYLLRFGKYLAGSSSLFWDVTQHRMLVCNQPTLHNIQAGRVSRIHHDGILKSLLF